MKPTKLLPLVLAATEAATREAERLGLSRPLENLVTEAIDSGRVANGVVVGRSTTVFLDEARLAVHVKRTRSPLTGRRAWTPVGVERIRT